MIKQYIQSRIDEGLLENSPWDIADELYPELESFSYWSDDKGSAHNPLFEKLIEHHMLSFAHYYKQWIEDMVQEFEKQETTEFYAGDIDFVIKLIKSTEEKIVITFRCSCSCADVIDWIIIYDKTLFGVKIHVRELHSKSDYPKSDYPQKLNLKFYRDRHYEMEFKQELHGTKLGGVYGDIRDKGYICSYYIYHQDYDISKPMNVVENITDLSDYYPKWKRFTFMLQCANKYSVFK